MKIKVKAKVTFAGPNLKMVENEIKEIDEKENEELIKIGYIEKIVSKKKEK